MKITIYTITDCQFSKQEKDYLTGHNLPFDERNLEVDKAYLTEMLAISNNFAGTPVTKIEKDNGQTVVLKGFTKDEFDKELGFSATSTPQTTPAVNAVPSASASVQPSPAVPTPPSQPQPSTPPPIPPPVTPAPMPSAPVPPPSININVPIPQAPVNTPPPPAASPAPAAQMPPPPPAAPKPNLQSDPSMEALLNDLQKKSNYGSQPSPPPSSPQNSPAPAAPSGPANFPNIPDPDFGKS